MSRRSTRTLGAVATAVLVLAVLQSVDVLADDVQLNSGLFLRGKAFPVMGLDKRTSTRNLNATIPSEPYYVIDDGVRRYFVPKRQAQVESKDELSGVPEFKFQRTPRSRTLTPEVIGASTIDNWEHGRRVVHLKTKRGDVPIIEEITRLRPDFAVFEGVTHDWEHGIDTRLIPPDQIRELLQRDIDPKKLDDRKAVLRFYLDAEMYAEASRELQGLMADFPDQRTWGETQLPLIEEQNFRKGMREVLRRQAAGQHALAYEIAKKAPPDKVSVEVQRQAEEIVDYYQKALEQRERALLLLEQLEAKLPSEAAQPLMPLRLALRDELHIEIVDRLDPFLRAEQDANLTTEQKLALAYSAWVVGPSYADVDLNVAKNLWQARFLALEYIRAAENAVRRQELAEQITALEGVSIDRLAQMIPLLPYALEENPLLPGQAREYSVPIPEQQPSTYQVCLPLEYHPQHRYPLIVALRRSGQTLTQTIRWWAGDTEQPGAAMRRGYIVIAPEFAAANTDDFDYSVQAHRQILAAIDDVRKKFSVDSDRIFIAGHELGGDACYDIALSHPDLFAGAVPFLAQPDRYCIRMWKNGLRLSWYIITGERDRDTLAHNARIVNSLVRSSKVGDIVYCEYKARGFESYFEELPRLFDWMDGRRRIPLADVKGGWEMDIMRPTENRFFWVEITRPSDQVFKTIVWEKPPVRAPQELTSKVTAQGNSMYVTTPGAAARIWLSPELIDFEKRLQVTMGDQKFNNFVRPSAADLLEDFRVRGDRQRLFWAALDL